MCVYCNRSQKTSQRVKNNSHATLLHLVDIVLFCSLHVTSSVIYYSTYTRKNIIYLLNNIYICVCNMYVYIYVCVCVCV